MPRARPASADDLTHLEGYRDALKRYFSRRIDNPAEVDDLVQEAFSRLLRFSQKGEKPDNPEAWLFRVARNLVTDHYRRNGKMVQEPLDGFGSLNEPARQEDARHLADTQFLLEAALDELSDSCRAAFIMRRFEDLDTAQIAARLGISRRMVQKYLVQAMTHLYLRLAPVMEGRP